MQQLLEDVIRLLGWTVLKAVTLGRYKSSDASSVLLEGGVGLSVIAAAMCAAYAWSA